MADDPFDKAPRLAVVADNGAAPSVEKRKRKPRGPSRVMAVDVITEDAIALTFTREYGASARYDHEIGRWAIWDAEERFWQWDKRQLAGYWCRALARAASEGRAAKVLERVQRKGFVSGVEVFCRMDPSMR
ncbi:hypothetical protein [Paenirhodobacter sp.]|uniref:hypothetical protein n=1 Tax=Paenirhodobacter sp. TaxID=1965326 RepID=UPI003B50FA29